MYIYDFTVAQSFQLKDNPGSPFPGHRLDDSGSFWEAKNRLVATRVHYFQNLKYFRTLMVVLYGIVS